MSSEDQEILQSLLNTLTAGTDIYRDAIARTKINEHKVIFERMVRSRNAVVAYLQPYKNLAENAVEPGHTFGSVLHKIYPEILTGLNSQHDTTIIAQLEQVEQDTLKKMQRSLQCIQSPLLKSVILDLHPKLTYVPDPQPFEKAC